MVAFIAAVPEVIFSYPDVVLHHLRDVSVSWDTGDPAVKGRIFHSANGAPEAPLPGPPLRAGTLTDKIALDQVLTLVLRKATNGEEMARTKVTTRKDALATYMTDPDLDFIFSLKVNPGVDTLGIAFQTKQPAVPYVEIRRHDGGELVDSWMGGSFRQQHQNEFNGFGRGLPQETVLDVRIVALKDAGGGRVSLGTGAHNPEVRGPVTMGARTVSFLFDLIHVRTDGDPGGAGEFTFTFGVGDVATQKRLGPSQVWGEGDIPAGYDREVSKLFTVDHAPRRLWAQVNAWEDDTSFFNPETQGFGWPALGPAFSPPGSNGYETDYGSFASVTGHFDTDLTASGRQRGFIMSTGDFSIAYDVFGSVTVIRRNGTNNFRGLSIGRVKRPRRSDRVQLNDPIVKAGRAHAARTSQGLTTVNLGADGNVIVRTVDPRTETGTVVDLGGRFDESITVVESAHDTLHVFGVTTSGEVAVRTFTPGSATEGEWVRLGGTFIGDVVCVERYGCVDVLARDAEGHVFYRRYPDGAGGDWTRIGSGRVRSMVATGTPAGDLAVFALDGHGRILHKRRCANGEWMPRPDEWDVVCYIEERSAVEGTPAVHWASEKDLIVSVFVGDDLVGAVMWCGYPEPKHNAEWVPVISTERAERGGVEANPDGAEAVPA